MKAKGFDIYAPETKGFIYRRINKNGIDMPYDFRACRWRRWEIDYEAIPTAGGLVNEKGVVVRNSGTANNIVYLCVKRVALLAPTTYAMGWQPLVNLSDTRYLADDISSDNKWYASTEILEGMGAALPLTGEFRDMNTFANYDGSDANPDEYLNGGNVVRGGYNNVFYNSCRSNEFGELCVGNTLCESAWNHAGAAFSRNVAGKNFCNNAFGDNCFKNLFGEDVYDNRIANKFYENMIGSNSVRNVFGAEFFANSVSINCQNNTFGALCAYNNISHAFMNNHIDGNFAYTLIGDALFDNSFGCGVNTCVFGVDGSHGTGRVPVWCQFGPNLSGCDFVGINALNNVWIQCTVQRASDGKVVITWRGVDGAAQEAIYAF
jgi:hypothetical protein